MVNIKEVKIENDVKKEYYDDGSERHLDKEGHPIYIMTPFKLVTHKSKFGNIIWEEKVDEKAEYFARYENGKKVWAKYSDGSEHTW